MRLWRGGNCARCQTSTRRSLWAASLTLRFLIFYIVCFRSTVGRKRGFSVEPPTKTSCNKTSVADPDLGSGAFLTLDPWSWIGFFRIRISDPESQTHIFDSLMTNLWVKSTIILSVLAKKSFFPLPLLVLFLDPGSEIRYPGSEIRYPGSEIRYPGWINIRIRDPG